MLYWWSKIHSIERIIQMGAKMTTKVKDRNFVYLKMTLSRSLHGALKAESRKAGVPISNLVRLALAEKYGSTNTEKSQHEPVE